MVIAYDMGLISRLVIGSMLKIDTVTLVNLVSETRAVPEFIGKDCKAERIGLALQHILKAPTAQVQAIEATMIRLGRGDQDLRYRAARAVLTGLGRA
jgi:lipid-A-disaccharide synthase